MGVLTYGRQYRVQFEENSFVFGNVPDEVIEVVFDQEVCLVHQSGKHFPQVGVSPPFLQGLRHTTRSALATINLCNSSFAICEIHGWMLGQNCCCVQSCLSNSPAPPVIPLARLDPSLERMLLSVPLKSRILKQGQAKGYGSNT